MPKVPNIADPDFFWNWLKANKANFYDTYWANRGISEYEFIYKKSLEQKFRDLNITDFNTLGNLMREKWKKQPGIGDSLA